MGTSRLRLEGPVPGGGALLAERWLYELADTLQVEDPAEPITVRVGAHGSGVVGTEVFVEARSDGALGASGWFELLLRHELTHLLVEQSWGRGPALFWEGLPVALADASVRGRRLGTSYTAHAGALVAAGRWLPLTDLLLASEYYPRRTDPRVDLEAGVLCGWLLARGALPGLRSLFRGWSPPTPERPEVRLVMLAEALGDDLVTLERELCASLVDEPDPALVARQRDAPERPRGGPHCDFCFGPRASDPCERCGAPAVPVVVVDR